MKRGITGRFHITNIGGEEVRSFIPNPLPADPPSVEAEHSLTSFDQVSHPAGVTFPTATMGIEALVRLRIARELTGKQRKRVFAYGRYLAILNEGTEPL